MQPHESSSRPCISVNEAARLIESGLLVGFPTETVYGLGGDATNSEAVQKIFAAKGRPANNPLIVHTNSVERLSEIVTLPQASTEPAIYARVNALSTLWPGPLTIVLPKSPAIAPNVTNGARLVGVRIPAHDLALQFLALCRHPVAAPSANRSNRVSPTSAAHVQEEFDGAVAVLDGGDSELGLESTVVEPQEGGVIIHRPGYITLEQVEALAGPIIKRPHDGKSLVASPGQLALHYAPTTPCYLFSSFPANKTPDCIIGLHEDLSAAQASIPPSARIVEFGSLAAYAAGLYRALRDIDRQQQAKAIAIIAPAPHGLGLAICDRLSRASHR